MAFLEEPIEINEFDRSKIPDCAVHGDPARLGQPPRTTRSTVRGVETSWCLVPCASTPYEFVTLAALRAKQLLAGCTPRLEGDHNAATMAQMEVAAGRVVRADEQERP
jgi:DNA-directed RNA polymerase subunit K/omega